jgi:NADH:ubiquinone oxidoreductase subunit H
MNIATINCFIFYTSLNTLDIIPWEFMTWNFINQLVFFLIFTKLKKTS